MGSLPMDRIPQNSTGTLGLEPSRQAEGRVGTPDATSKILLLYRVRGKITVGDGVCGASYSA